MKTIKVNQTKEVQTSSGTVKCVEGMLVLIRIGALSSKPKEPFEIDLSKQEAVLADYYKPIIISETEEIELRDWAYEKEEGTLFEVDEFGHAGLVRSKKNSFVLASCRKILALPEHFTPEQLQDIVDGKMKDGDTLLVGCVKSTAMDLSNQTINQYFKIESPLTLHKAEESWEDIFKEYSRIRANKKINLNFYEWVYKNFNPPKRK